MKHNSKFPTPLLLLFLLLICLLSCHPNNSRHHGSELFADSTHSNEADPTVYKVIGIKDGDTFVVLMDGEEQTIRLAHIDCPEKKTALWQQSKAVRI